MGLLLSVLGKVEATAQGIHRSPWREAGDHGLPAKSRTRRTTAGPSSWTLYSKNVRKQLKQTSQTNLAYLGNRVSHTKGQDRTQRGPQGSLSPESSGEGKVKAALSTRPCLGTTSFP